MGYAIVAFFVVFLLISSALLLLFYRHALGQRLSSILSPGGGSPSFLEHFGLRQAAESFAGLSDSIRKAVPGEKQVSAIRRRLVLAGYRRNQHLKLFKVAKIALPAALWLISFATGLYRWNPLLVFVLALILGYLLPDYWLDNRIQARERAICRGLPDFLDLMVVCLEAGLSIDQAAIRSSEEMRFSHPALADELGLVMLEVRAGQPRLTAWKHLAERTNVEEIHILVTILVQADQFGTGVSRTLRIHADTLRMQRKHKVEELAAKTSVKLVFPLVFFIFPSFLVVVLGPAAISILEAFQAMHK